MSPVGVSSDGTFLQALDGIPPFESPFLGDGIAAACGRIDDYAAELLPAERAGTERMAPARLAQYSSGRRVAREALGILGFGVQAVPRRERAPIWPAGAVGSIAHSREFAIAVVGRETRTAGIGIDLEVAERVPSRLALRVLTAPEQGIDLPDARTLLFSAKEAVYKAVNPLAREYLAFRDVELAVDEAGGFRARTTRQCRSAHAVAAGIGYHQQFAGHWLTAFVLPRQVPTA